MKIFLILVALALAIALFLRRNRDNDRSTRTNSRPGKTTLAKVQADAAEKTRTVPAGGQYRSTSIRAGRNACVAAREIAGKRFLLSEVPGLPLADCSAAQCDCTYSHHQDRRDDIGDRRAPAGLSTELFSESGKTERRADPKGRGRRTGD